MKEYPYSSEFMLVLDLKGSVYYPRKYSIISNEKGRWFLVRCTVLPYVQPGKSPYSYTRVTMNQSVGDSILKIFEHHKIAGIKSMDEGCEDKEYKRRTRTGAPVTCNISDGLIKELIIIVKDRYIIKQYYEPEFWEKNGCCPANKDRQVFIQCYNALMQAR